MRREVMGQKGFARVITIIFLIVVVGIVGYLIFTKRSPSQPSSLDLKQVTSKSTLKSQPDSCNLISDSTFRSIDKYEVGLGPNGPEMGYWAINFRGDEFEWDHSDVTESGTYTCKDNVLQVKFSGYSTIARYDGYRKILIWNNVEYRKVE